MDENENVSQIEHKSRTQSPKRIWRFVENSQVEGRRDKNSPFLAAAEESLTIKGGSSGPFSFCLIANVQFSAQLLEGRRKTTTKHTILPIL